MRKRSEFKPKKRPAKKLPKRSSVKKLPKRSSTKEKKRPQFLNAYYDGPHVVFVGRGKNGERKTWRTKGMKTCFFREDDMSPKLKRALKEDPRVQSVTKEGKWFRTTWLRPYESEKVIKALHEKVPTFEATISSIRRIVADERIQIAQPIRGYIDIETDSRVPPRKAAEGEARILSWGVVGEDGTEYGGMLEEDTDKDEARLLSELWEVLTKFDQMCAWYGDNFDFPVIKERSRRVGLNVKVDSKRILWLDQMVCFAKLNTMAAKSGAEKQSYALQKIAMELLGVGKNDFDASRTWEAWEAGGEDRKEMYEYMMQDVRLLPGIEEKTGYIQLHQTLCEVTGAFPDTRGLNPGSQVENYLLRIGMDRNFHFPSKFRTKRSNDGDQFAGAFVMDPTIKGLAYNVHVADFSRLYPSIIMTWNMSPETKQLGPKGDRGTFFDESAPQCVASTGTTFRTDRDGILAIALRKILDLRKKWKKEIAKHPPNTPKWVEAYRRSTAYKIAANSFYGVIGSPMSRFYDNDVAEAVTQCGVWLIKETMREAERRGMSVVYGDTDSLFVQGATREEFDEFVKWCNKNLYPKILKEQGCANNFIDLGYEKAFERIVMVKKKRYAGRYLHYDGKEASEESLPEIKGLEFKRGDTSKLTRDFQEEVANRIVGFKCEPVEDPDVIAEIVDRWRERILNGELTLEDVQVSKRLNKPLEGKGAYIRKTKLDGTPGRLPAHAEVALILQERGEDVREGTRVSYYCTDGSSSPKEFKPADDWDGNFDRYSLWDDFVWPPTMRVVEAAYPGYDWKRYKRTRPKTRRLGSRRTIPNEQEPLF